MQPAMRAHTATEANNCTRAAPQLFFYALAFEPTGPVVHMLFTMSYAVRDW